MAPGGDTGQSLLRLSGRPDVMFGDDQENPALPDRSVLGLVRARVGLDHR